MSKTASIKHNAIINVVRTLLSIAFPLITFPYATRILLPEGIGKVNFASSIISYYIMIAGLGIGTYGIRETAKRRDNKQQLTQITKELFILNIIPTVCAYILLFISILLISKFQEYKSLLLIYSATILFTTLGMDWFYSGLEKYDYITIRQLVFQLISLILLFVFVHQKNDYIKYACISVFANAGSNICNFVHTRHFINWKQKGPLNLVRHLSPVFVLFGMRIAASIYTALDTTMLGFFSNDKEVGYYSAANKITRIIVTLIVSVTAVLLPRLSYYIEKNNIADFKRILYKSFDLLLLFSIPAVLGLFALSKNIILLLSGSEFLPSVKIMHILCFLIFIIPISSFIGSQLFLPLGKEKISLYTMIVGATINFILNSLLIPHYSGLGASIASIIAEGSITLLYIFFARKIINYRKLTISFLEYVFSAGIMFIIVISINKLHLNSWSSIIISIGAGSIIYISILVLLKNKCMENILCTVKMKLTNHQK